MPVIAGNPSKRDLVVQGKRNQKPIDALNCYPSKRDLVVQGKPSSAKYRLADSHPSKRDLVVQGKLNLEYRYNYKS